MSEPVQVFDGHNDTLLRLELAARQGIALDFAAGAPAIDIDLPRARASGLAGGLFAMFSPADRDFSIDFDPSDPAVFASVDQSFALNFTLAMFARMRKLAQAHPDDIEICTDVPAVRTAMKSGRMAIVPHIEGAECIDTDLNALEVLHAAGLRSLGLVWSRPNAFWRRRPDGTPT